MGWWKPYNVSGTIHVGDRLGELGQLVKIVLKTQYVDQISHYIGGATICASSDVAFFISTGRDVHEFYALVAGERSEWLAFASALEHCLITADFPYSIVVHTETINAKSADAGSRIDGSEDRS